MAALGVWFSAARFVLWTASGSFYVSKHVGPSLKHSVVGNTEFPGRAKAKDE
jgi:hypothetical protein